MQHSIPPAKRSHYPLTVLLILLAHLGLGYFIYQQATQVEANANGTELQAIQQQETPAIP